MKREPTTLLTRAAGAAVIVVGMLVILGVIAITLKLFEYGVAPVLSYVSGGIFRLLLVPGALPALAAATVVVGLVMARKFQPRGVFLTGVIVVTLAFVCLWQLPRVIAALPTPEARVQLEAPLLIAGLIISVFLLVAGFQVIRRCQWVREDRATDKG